MHCAECTYRVLYLNRCTYVRHRRRPFHLATAEGTIRVRYEGKALLTGGGGDLHGRQGCTLRSGKERSGTTFAVRARDGERRSRRQHGRTFRYIPVLLIHQSMGIATQMKPTFYTQCMENALTPTLNAQCSMPIPNDPALMTVPESFIQMPSSNSP
jgi:hypothetical protein